MIGGRGATGNPRAQLVKRQRLALSAIAVQRVVDRLEELEGAPVGGRARLREDLALEVLPGLHVAEQAQEEANNEALKKAHRFRG